MRGTAVYNWNKVIEKALQMKWQAAFDTPGHSSVSYTISKQHTYAENWSHSYLRHGGVIL